MVKKVSEPADAEPVRLDKWLWAARFFKSRTLAQEAISGGKVHYNGQRFKPGREVQIGALLRIRLGWDEKEVVVRALSARRGAAPIAQQLYEETSASLAAREARGQMRQLDRLLAAPPPGRPTKRQRRQLHNLQDASDFEP
ncbi:MAG TPA: S4 domain-containing protein [Pseudomonadales bacterium]|nr:S4 domain-containing protein [Pseudomonadales bacterium]